MSEFLIGRQQIYDRHLNVFGYELLFRSLDENIESEKEGTTASQRLIVDALLEMGLERLTGKARAFINLTAENILRGDAELLPKEKVIIEILENAKITPDLVHAVGQLVNAGYRIALDDFVFDPQWEPLVRMAHIIKVDVRAEPMEKVACLIERLERYPVKILLEKIETEEEFRHYQDLGGDYYQGFLFDRPRIVTGQRLDPHRQALLNVLAEIHQPNADIKHIAEVIGRDASLSYKLLNFINSASFGLKSKIETMNQAVVLLGLRELKRWTALLMLTQSRRSANRPNELLRIALIRARMCELLAEQMKRPDSGDFFLTGLFSNLDLLLGQPLDEILKNLPLADNIQKGLLHHQGPMGIALRCTLNYEKWHLSAVQQMNAVSLPKVSQLYLSSVTWADQIYDSLAEKA